MTLSHRNLCLSHVIFVPTNTWMKWPVSNMKRQQRSLLSTHPWPCTTALPKQEGRGIHQATTCGHAGRPCQCQARMTMGRNSWWGVVRDAGPSCMGGSRSTSCSQLSVTGNRSCAHAPKPRSVLFFFSKKHTFAGELSQIRSARNYGHFFNVNTMLSHYMCSQGITAWGKEWKYLFPTARRCSNWDKKSVVRGQSQAEGIAGQGRNFSPLKSLQNPIGKAELHPWEVNILILRWTAMTKAVQNTGNGHCDLARVPCISLCLSQKRLWTFCLAWPKVILLS